MQPTDRDLFLKWWQDAWTEGLGAASWSGSLRGLTAEQAAWQPTGGDGKARHSIWQIVEHMIFWRGNLLGRLDGGARPTAADLAAHNFPQPTEISEQSWAETRRRFEGTHQKVLAAVRERGDAAASLMEFLPHDSYHIGQINYIRALLGLGPVV
jgi:uncharacterized damage-inducible protein DinB